MRALARNDYWLQDFDSETCEIDLILLSMISAFNEACEGESEISIVIKEEKHNIKAMLENTCWFEYSKTSSQLVSSL